MFAASRTRIASAVLALGLALPLLPALDASAAIIPLSQARSVATDASTAVGGDPGPVDADSASAADFAAFDVDIDSTSTSVGGGAFLAFAEGRASQSSSLGPTVVSAAGSADAVLQLLQGEDLSAAANGSSSFLYEFSVDVLSSFALNGTLDTSAIVVGGASFPTLLNDLLFEDRSNAVVLFQALTNAEAFSVVGLLQPGTYRMSASASASGTVFSPGGDQRIATGTSSYDFVLEILPLPVPEPGPLALLLLGTLLVPGVRKVRKVRRVPGVRVGARPR